MKKPDTLYLPKNINRLLLKYILLFILFALTCYAANAQCTAGFTYNQSGGRIYFANTSSTKNSFIYLSTWDFGDGSSVSYSRNPNHVYAAAGTYLVKLIIQGDSAGTCRDTITDSIIVLENCNPAYSYSVSGYNLALSAKLQSLSYKYKWVIRNANGGLVSTYTGTSPYHSFTSAGTYTVTLTVENAAIKCIDSLRKTILISAPQCKPNFNASVKGYEARILVSPQMGKTFTYSFGDGTDSVTVDSFMTHDYGKGGTYWLCITAEDSATGCKDSTCKKIVINDTACNAGFQYSISENTVTLYPSTNKVNTKYEWTLGDSTTSDTSGSFSHTYSREGMYRICLKVSNSSCSATYCSGNINLFTCKADFSTTISGLQVDFKNTSNGGANTEYYWSFGDNTTSTDSDPQHTYSAAGSYGVCLLMKDSVRGCYDTVCQKVIVTDTTTCNAEFKVSVSGRSAYIIPVRNGSGASYKWSMGDGTTFTRTQYDTLLTHTYSNDSTYQICLIVTNGNCSDTMCETVIISSPGTFAISGNIYLGHSRTGADAAVVYLISYNPNDSTLSALDSANVTADSNGICSYRFTGNKNGLYYVKAGLDTSSPDYADYFPTYHDSLLEWYSALEITVNGTDEVADIYLVQGNNPGGPAFIGGKVLQGSLKKEGDPLSHIQVMLYNENRRPVAYTYSDENGNFSFSNLAYGTYEVYTEVPGIKTLSGFVTLSPANPRVDDVTVRVSASGITTGIRTKLGEDFIAQPKLYPNPAQHILYLETNLRNSQNASLIIYNITGQEVYSQNISLLQGNQTHTIDTEKLPAGLYMLYLKNTSGTDELHYKFIKTDK